MTKPPPHGDFALTGWPDGQSVSPVADWLGSSSHRAEYLGERGPDGWRNGRARRMASWRCLRRRSIWTHCARRRAVKTEASHKVHKARTLPRNRSLENRSAFYKAGEVCAVAVEEEERKGADDYGHRQAGGCEEDVEEQDIDDDRAE